MPVDAATPRSIHLLHNPAARGAPAVEELEAAAAPLRERGWAVLVRSSTRPGEIATLAGEAAAAGATVVAACGGDGTVHEAAGALAGGDTALAMIPAGTANVWAAEAGIPRDPAGALALIPRARRVRADLGVAEIGGERRHFLLMCGFGLDGHVVRRVGGGSAGKRRLGGAWYALVGAWSAARVGAYPATVRTTDADGAEHEREASLRLGIAGNTRLYGGVSRLASAARIDDGLLDLVTFEAAGPLGSARQLGRSLRGGLHRRGGGSIAYARVARAEVRPGRPLPVQLDGEYVGEATADAPLRLSVAPAALTVLLAPQPNPLLGER